MQIYQQIISLVTSAIILMTGIAPDNIPDIGQISTPGNSTGSSENGREKVDPSLITYASSYNFDKITADSVKSVKFSALLEAETIPETAGITFSTNTTGYTGKGYIDISDNKAFSLSVELPASQYYRITVRHCAGGHKENPLLFNGVKVLDIISENGGWVETTVDGIYLEKGKNTITIGEGWSWFSLDSILIEDSGALSDEIYSGIDDTLSNPYANLKTQNIYQYLKAIYGRRTLAGQCTDYGNNTETDALYLGLGKYPAIRAFDFIYDSMNFCNGTPQAKDVDLAIQWSNEGGLVVYDWHWYAPYGKCGFYKDDTDFSLSRAVTSVDIAELPLDEIQKLQKSGKISIETLKIIEDIDNISALMKRMEDAGVTVLWRPLHEASGGWFWWGASGADDYKWLWKLMYRRMTDYHELDNLIWVWNAQSADWYPGDEYCDIAAIDIYNGAHDYSTSSSVLQSMSTWNSENKKMVAMSECAAMPDPNLIVRDNAYWLWFAVWNWDYIVKNGTTELSDEYTSFEMMKKVYNSKVVITRDELPDFDK